MGVPQLVAPSCPRPNRRQAGPLKYFIYTSTYHSLHHSWRPRLLGTIFEAMLTKSSPLKWVWVEFYPPGNGPQVLVIVSIYQGAILGTYFDPQPSDRLVRGINDLGVTERIQALTSQVMLIFGSFLSGHHKRVICNGKNQITKR